MTSFAITVYGRCCRRHLVGHQVELTEISVTGSYQSCQCVTFCDPRDPSVSWPVACMTRDPWPSPRPWHESITTTHESWWVDYCLLFFAIWNSRYDLCSICSIGDWVLLSSKQASNYVAFINTNSMSRPRTTYK